MASFTARLAAVSGSTSAPSRAQLLQRAQRGLPLVQLGVQVDELGVEAIQPRSSCFRRSWVVISCSSSCRTIAVRQFDDFRDRSMSP